MRVRQEAKIVKNYHREYVWKEFKGCYIPVSRYSHGREILAHQRLEKAMRRRYRNAARKEWKANGDCSMFRYYNHKACSEYEIFDDALRWWNISDK